MEPLKTYRGTLHRGQLVTDVPMHDEHPLQVLVTVVNVSSEPHEAVDIRWATQPLDLKDEASQELRRLLRQLPTSLSEEIIAERRGDEA